MTPSKLLTQRHAGSWCWRADDPEWGPLVTDRYALLRLDHLPDTLGEIPLRAGAWVWERGQWQREANDSPELGHVLDQAMKHGQLAAPTGWVWQTLSEDTPLQVWHAPGYPPFMANDPCAQAWRRALPHARCTVTPNAGSALPALAWWAAQDTLAGLLIATRWPPEATPPGQAPT